MSQRVGGGGVQFPTAKMASLKVKRVCSFVAGILGGLRDVGSGSVLRDGVPALLEGGFTALDPLPDLAHLRLLSESGNRRPQRLLCPGNEQDPLLNANQVIYRCFWQEKLDVFYCTEKYGRFSILFILCKYIIPFRLHVSYTVYFLVFL